MPVQYIPAIVIGILVVIFLYIIIYASRYFKCGPNQVLVISGRKKRIVTINGQRETVGFDILKGGGRFAWPFIEKVDFLSLELMTLEVKGDNVYTKEGVPVTVDGVAQIKVKGDDVSIRTAAEQFLRGGMKGIEETALETLEGHLRAILGTLTVEEIYRERDVFSQSVLEVASDDMAKMGLTIVSFTIKDVKDEQGYLESLGQKRISEVKSEADIGQAEAERDAIKGEAKAKQEGESAKYGASTKIAEAERDYKIKLAEFDVLINKKQAESGLAYDLQKYKTSQDVSREKVQVDVVAKEMMVEVEEQGVVLKEKELEATIERKADAELFKVEALSSAEKYQLKAEAEGKALATKAKAEAESAVIKAQGFAKADVTKAKGIAEAEAMRMKAEAWQTYNQAAITQVIMEKLPEIAQAVSTPLAKTERIVIIGDGDGVGAARITDDITKIVAQLPLMVESLSGLNLKKIVAQIPEMVDVEKMPQKAEFAKERPVDIPRTEEKVEESMTRDKT
ncbi:flotillin family protein [Candidatus Poribacteria bacterium]|nr:flotillin family protein [Candidatus Poribacteria bacterium]